MAALSSPESRLAPLLKEKKNENHDRLVFSCVRVALYYYNHYYYFHFFGREIPKRGHHP